MRFLAALCHRKPVSHSLLFRLTNNYNSQIRQWKLSVLRHSFTITDPIAKMVHTLIMAKYASAIIHFKSLSYWISLSAEYRPFSTFQLSNRTWIWMNLCDKLGTLVYTLRLIVEDRSSEAPEHREQRNVGQRRAMTLSSPHAWLTLHMGRIAPARYQLNKYLYRSCGPVFRLLFEQHRWNAPLLVLVVTIVAYIHATQVHSLPGGYNAFRCIWNWGHLN